MKCMNIAESRVFSHLFALSVIRQFLHHSHHIFPTAIFLALSLRFCEKNIGEKIMQCCTIFGAKIQIFDNFLAIFETENQMIFEST